MNEANAHFDEIFDTFLKENQGFNCGRHERGRPSTAILGWRPNKPFLTYERAPMTKGQNQVHTVKRMHSKVMNDRVQVYNTRFVAAENKKMARSHSCEHLPINETQKKIDRPRKQHNKSSVHQKLATDEKPAKDGAV